MAKNYHVCPHPKGGWQVKAAGSFAAFSQNYDLDCPEALELDLMKKQRLLFMIKLTTFLMQHVVYLITLVMLSKKKLN